LIEVIGYRMKIISPPRAWGRTWTGLEIEPNETRELIKHIERITNK